MCGMKISEQIKGLLAEDPDLSIVSFAAEAKVHTQTVYNALNEKPLKPRSVNKISKAVSRLSGRQSFKDKAVS